MSTLDVLLNGTKVAELDDAAGDGMAALRYTEECRAEHEDGAPLLSVRLPVREESYSGMDTRAWLDGLLPEGSVREILADKAKVDKNDVIGFLRVYGRDCAGAVSIVRTNGAVDDAAGVAWLSDNELNEAVRKLPQAPYGSSVTKKVRVSLGGVQGKLVVVVDGDRIGIPEGLQPSTHILKPTPRYEDGSERYPGIVTAEAMCMRLFHHLGLSTAEVDILDLATGPALLVTRYDRSGKPNSLVRLHQEDLCQALGLRAIHKYQEPDVPVPPSLARLVTTLRSFGGASVPVLREVLGRVFANALVTNCDAHAKNWSLMLPGSEVALAPVYDVIPSTLWEHLDINTDLAMKVGGCTAQSEIRAVHLLAEAKTWGMGAPAAAKHLDLLTSRVHGALERARADIARLGGDESVVAAVATIVAAQLPLLRPS